MSAADVKDQMPPVTIRMKDGTIVEGMLTGRMLPFATVYARIGREWIFVAEWSWESIAHCLTNNNPLRA